MMLSKAKIKFIKSLQIKKYRKQEQCFIVQGAKSVQESLKSDFEIRTIYGTSDFLQTLSADQLVKSIEVTAAELAMVSEFQTNDTALALVQMKPNVKINLEIGEYAFILDDIRDPGNLGTIIRTADWYGITRIIASEETADFYNPKVISASMGSFTRATIFYTALDRYLSEYQGKVYGTFLNGKNIHEVKFKDGGVVVVGNESKGISATLEKYITDKITIPRFGKAESLNAAIATAIVCDNIRRMH